MTWIIPSKKDRMTKLLTNSCPSFTSFSMSSKTVQNIWFQENSFCFGIFDWLALFRQRQSKGNQAESASQEKAWKTHIESQSSRRLWFRDKHIERSSETSITSKACNTKNDKIISVSFFSWRVSWFSKNKLYPFPEECATKQKVQTKLQGRQHFRLSSFVSSSSEGKEVKGLFDHWSFCFFLFLSKNSNDDRRASLWWHTSITATEASSSLFTKKDSTRRTTASSQRQTVKQQLHFLDMPCISSVVLLVFVVIVYSVSWASNDSRLTSEGKKKSDSIYRWCLVVTLLLSCQQRKRRNNKTTKALSVRRNKTGWLWRRRRLQWHTRHSNRKLLREEAAEVEVNPRRRKRRRTTAAAEQQQ